MTYSPGEYLAKFLDSLDSASVRDTIVIMADNGSVDGVPEAAAEARDNVEFLPTGGNLGYGTAINIAARALRERREAGEIDGEFFLVSNPDVVFDSGSIDELLSCADRHPQAGSIGPLIREADGSAYPSARAVPTLANGIGHALLGSVWKSNPWSAAYRDENDMSRERSAGWLSGSCLLIRWDAFDHIGGFDERYFMYMEDVDLGDRLARAGYENIFCPTAQITHAKGHVAGKNPEHMLPAHHESAYRFQADRLSAPWQAPIRLALRMGLKARAGVAVGISKIRR
ncbi:N-acetylglucosaminyl-diphospho-decaprenol L-rhamnosyltransferase [Corynebacterium deserti GIMN1.010]|uniref:N-acetylglucosaminyl-diphospho-decaprenol L-rhamnosyltransferase n=1 Tax=Corynebacterium deserti GIMN1.010 TaxID=931089 RepID=A0A0M4CVW6_9CORY|nr:N-acetylglucosaminyl-diphospho-decaprenol L-rhamnosyltransferase [Corynebacterium deserti GIMN1.010]